MEDAPFPAGAGQVVGLQGCGHRVPVDGGHRGAAAGAVADELAVEVVAVQEGAVTDQQGDAGLNWVDPGGAGAECCGKVIDVHGDLRVLSGWRR